MRKTIITYLLIITSSAIVFSQNQKTIKATFNNDKIKIDGLINEEIWDKTKEESNFFQFEPYNGKKPSQKTSFRFAYDNNAIYIAAKCYNNKSGEIYDILSKRDDFGQADYLGIYIDPYKTGITGYGFFVTAAGVQVDLKLDETAENRNWDAVWYSAVNKTDSLYSVEIKIPYSAFRFPKQKNQSWNINIYRNIHKNRELATWNYVDNSKNGILNQMGQICNLKGIKPPIRLTLFPYVSAYAQKYAGIEKIGKTYSGGLDLKYGINESFTLDMMLIPDYNQIESDEQVLNLSPYETYYDEKRYFFTEGTEIFNKGNIFYSRRIGKEPSLYDQVPYKLNDNEIIVKNPQMTQIYNATKISGKTNKGFGIGFLNALTGNAYAHIYDTINDRTRTIITEPFSNYNIIALNQPLKNNSYISFTNTNYSVFGRKYYANVSAQEGKIKNKDNSWAFFERFSVSNIFNDTLKPQTGFSYKFYISKTSGNFRINAGQIVFSDKYNPNDLGYLRQNNLVTNYITGIYNVYEPFGKFLLWRNSITIRQKSLYDSLRYIGTNISLNTSTKLRNNLSIGAILELTPDEVYDYFEPRVENRFFVQKPSQSLSLWISSNYAKAFALDIQTSYYLAKLDNKSQRGCSFLFSPRIRFSNKAFFIFSNEIRFDNNDLGYVGTSQSQDSVFFGKRDIKYNTNTIEFDYIFSKDISLNLKVRHYWSLIDYYEFFTLGNNGKLYPLRYSYHFISNKDINYNIFTVDLIFRWIFMPGSEFSVVFKKQITSNTTNLIYDYYDNFENMYFHSPRLNSISFKLIIYLDYNNIINRYKKTNL